MDIDTINLECQKECTFLEEIAFNNMNDRKIAMDHHMIKKTQHKNHIDTKLLIDITKRTGLIRAVGDNGTRICDRDHLFIHLTF